MGRLYKKRKKLKFCQRLATSDRHNSAMIIDRRKFITKGCLVSILPLESIQSHFRGLYFPYKKPPQIFFDVGRLLTTRHITHITLTQRYVAWPGDVIRPRLLRQSHR